MIGGWSCRVVWYGAVGGDGGRSGGGVVTTGTWEGGEMVRWMVGIERKGRMGAKGQTGS